MGLRNKGKLVKAIAGLMVQMDETQDELESLRQMAEEAEAKGVDVSQAVMEGLQQSETQLAAIGERLGKEDSEPVPLDKAALLEVFDHLGETPEGHQYLLSAWTAFSGKTGRMDTRKWASAVMANEFPCPPLALQRKS